MIFVPKLLHNRVILDLSVDLARHADWRYARKHLSEHALIDILARTATFKYSFFPRIIIEWNAPLNENVQVPERSRFLNDLCKHL